MENTIHPITNIYAKAMQGNIAEARSEFAAYLRNGVSYPRGKMLDYVQGQRIAKKTALDKIIELQKTGTVEEIQNLKLAYLNSISKVFDNNSHPLVKNARKDLNNSFNKIYPDIRTQRITKFIMLKEMFPFLKKFKWLTKFM